jgi:hypothetical protein
MIFRYLHVVSITAISFIFLFSVCSYLPKASQTLAQPFAPEFGIQILAHPVCKMGIIQEPKKVAL